MTLQPLPTLIQIPPKSLVRLRAAWAAYQQSKTHFEEMLNVVAETLGIDTDAPGLQAQLDRGVITLPTAPTPDPQEGATSNGALANDH